MHTFRFAYTTNTYLLEILLVTNYSQIIWIYELLIIKMNTCTSLHSPKESKKVEFMSSCQQIILNHLKTQQKQAMANKYVSLE